MGLIKLQQLEGELGRTEGSSEKIEMHEQLLMECQDAMQIVREDIASEAVSTFSITPQITQCSFLYMHQGTTTPLAASSHISHRPIM